jgi:hypothetical protein
MSDKCLVGRSIHNDSKDAEYFEMIINLKEQIYSLKLELKERNTLTSDKDELIHHLENENK